VSSIFRYDNTQDFVGSQEDFQTVAAHEIGHALRLCFCICWIPSTTPTQAAASRPRCSTCSAVEFEQREPTAANPFTYAQFTAATRRSHPRQPGLFLHQHLKRIPHVDRSDAKGDGNQASALGRRLPFPVTFVGIMDRRR
jgi:hypothetical protein